MIKYDFTYTWTDRSYLKHEIQENIQVFLCEINIGIDFFFGLASFLELFFVPIDSESSMEKEERNKIFLFAERILWIISSRKKKIGQQK